LDEEDRARERSNNTARNRARRESLNAEERENERQNNNAQHQQQRQKTIHDIIVFSCLEEIVILIPLMPIL
jgi:negative regulator of genetic competence, sporulation and motility